MYIPPHIEEDSWVWIAGESKGVQLSEKFVIHIKLEQLIEVIAG
jgi:hypothetical protein